MHKIATTGKFDDIKGTVAAYLDTLDVEKWFNSYGEKFDIDIENFNIDTIETTFIDTYQVLIKFNCRDITTNEIKVFQNPGNWGETLPIRPETAPPA